MALNQIAEGADVVFQVAGQCGLGALSAAKEQSKWGMGVDADQGYIGAHVLTSAQKKVNVAVFSTINMVKKGTFKGGTDTLFNVKNKGVGYGQDQRQGPEDAQGEAGQGRRSDRCRQDQDRPHGREVVRTPLRRAGLRSRPALPRVLSRSGLFAECGRLV